MNDLTYFFEPTFTFNGRLIFPSLMSGLKLIESLLRWKTEVSGAAIHLASLGVKIVGPSFWVIFVVRTANKMNKN